MKLHVLTIKHTLSLGRLWFAHSQYRIIRRDRKRGGGGLLVYIRSNVTAHRQINLEPEGVESICLDVKGYANNWFLICACYRSPGKCKITDFIPACATAAHGHPTAIFGKISVRKTI